MTGSVFSQVVIVYRPWVKDDRTVNAASSAYAARIRDACEQRGISACIPYDPPTGPLNGEQKRAFELADVLVLALLEHWDVPYLRSGRVCPEIEAFARNERNGKRLVMMSDEAARPTSSKLPKDAAAFATCPAYRVDVARNFQHDVDAPLRRIGEIIHGRPRKVGARR